MRHMRVRNKVVGNPARPRLSVFRSARNMFAQLIDDHAGQTLLAESTLSKSFKKGMKTGGNVKAASRLGELVAEKALKQGIKRVVYDRGGYLYHGRVKALADAARKKGLDF